jgi:hypothetical protein
MFFEPEWRFIDFMATKFILHLFEERLIENLKIKKTKLKLKLKLFQVVPKQFSKNEDEDSQLMVSDGMYVILRFSSFV